MKIESIKKHLSPYSISQKRKTTINHAFASAIAPCHPYKRQEAEKAMHILGIHDMDNLVCIYCGEIAETWDHLVGLVKNNEPTGYGHELGNLVPSCKACNSSKGNKGWRSFIEETVKNKERKEKIIKQLEIYIKSFNSSRTLVSEKEKSLLEEYRLTRDAVLEQMIKADAIASEIRKIRIKQNSVATN